MLKIYRCPAPHHPGLVTLQADAETWHVALTRLREQRETEVARAVQRAISLAGPDRVLRLSLPKQHALTVVRVAEGTL